MAGPKMVHDMILIMTPWDGSGVPMRQTFVNVNSIKKINYSINKNC